MKIVVTLPKKEWKGQRGMQLCFIFNISSRPKEHSSSGGSARIIVVITVLNTSGFIPFLTFPLLLAYQRLPAGLGGTLEGTSV